MLKDKDLLQLKSKGIEASKIELQIKNFKSGFPYSNIQKPAIANNGITQLSQKEIDTFLQIYDDQSKNKKVIKFVPASGAASRMFKSLFEFMEIFSGSEEEINNMKADNDFNSVNNFISNLKKFAFYNDLEKTIKNNGYEISDLLSSSKYDLIIEYLLTSKGLNYGKLPKGLLKFHNYNDINRTPFEEHLVEAAQYGKNNQEEANIHFTVSPEHMENFTSLANNIKTSYEKELNSHFNISFSTQKSSTDTIAVNMDNKPFRELDGSLLFRPGGHGALIENLNELDGDIIFIKNIDNVVPDYLKSDTTLYKKALGGLLIHLQNKLFNYLKIINEGNHSSNMINEIVKFAKDELNISIPNFNISLSNKEIKDLIFLYLNKPIRICGMVKNEGEPGGGPLWVKNSKEEISLQIVESSQINEDLPDQKAILQAATHFNPVDLICGTKNYLGNKFDLHQFIDPETGFISVKSKDGKDLKAQELPGLWNGAMANWITIFVEVPISTFNPVKTVNDLLRSQHQPE